MRIGFFYHPKNMPRPIDPDNVWSSSRGLTGSEMACFMYAIHMARLGHQVTLFTNFSNIGDIENVTCLPYEEWEQTYHKQNWDTLVSFMSSLPLRIANPGSTRIFNQQNPILNPDEKDWEKFVDYLMPLSHSHANFLSKQTNFNKKLYRVMHNGVEISDFTPSSKRYGKLIWASSHDRGLHWLLELYPRLKSLYPDLTLDVFYDTSGLHDFANKPYFSEMELGYRARYNLHALDKLSGKGVNVRGSVSRETMKEEMGTSFGLIYPLDPVHYTESFGVTVLEACASGTIPVLCGADAFEELWSPASLMSPAPYSSNKEAFFNSVLSLFNDKKAYPDRMERCIQYAKNFDWSVLAKKFDSFLKNTDEGLPSVRWS